MKIDSRGGWQAVNGPVTAMFKIAPENSQDLFLVSYLRLTWVTATEQRLTNTAAHRLAVHLDRDLEVDQKMISLFRNKKIILVSS